MSRLLLRRAEVAGAHVDVAVLDDRVAGIGPPGTLEEAGTVIDCAGGALLPGLHDHHVHLLSMAAALSSVDVSDGVEPSLRAAHRQIPPGHWIRAVQYDDVGDGPLDRWRLDALCPGRPVRVQHRSGAMWVLNSRALDLVGADNSAVAGLERDPRGRPTGRLFRLDEWLRARLPEEPDCGLAAVGRRLARFGVTGVTDCTPVTSTASFDMIADAVRSGALPVNVAVTGGPQVAEVAPPSPLRQGPVKIVLSDHDLPPLSDLIEWIGRAHRAGRGVAVHCVSRAALFLALAAWREEGSLPGDRVEHASVTPPDAMAMLADLSITVVTQPAFVVARGDMYLSEVEPSDRPDLYRCASLLGAGILVGGSTDAPFGPDDPWVAIAAAVDRRSRCGAVVGHDVGLTPAAALGLFMSPLAQPGGRIRHVRPGGPADLCLLDVPLQIALRAPASTHVAATIAGGACTYLA